MADLSDLQAAQPVKIVGSDSSGVETNPLPVSSIGARVDPSFSSGTNSRPTVTTTSSTILVANVNRKYVLIINQDNKTAFLKFADTAVINQGIPLMGGSALEINSTNLWVGSIQAIADSGTLVLDIFEGT